ncbi:O-antigen ligase family protein [Cnuibacter physcomitrellae]|uniref:O-antigen ligase family protein n=1 Tax=Cnuibacter physcomitrellae TaxID=1619308 RepID=UPI002175E5BE|nr:O-antigen ligase family protein [Cnuibacter physcomitrellae]MCS5497612.1 O-antigen ligase family protein [Cnuibacter physcomitrellae]
MTTIGTARRVTAPRAALVLVAAALVAFLPAALSPWVLPKLVVLAAAGVAAAIMVPRGRLPRWTILLVGLAAVVLAAAALMGDAPLAQLFGRWPRFEGAVALGGYTVALWIGARLLGPSATARDRELSTLALAVVALAIGGVAALETGGVRFLPGSETEATSRPGSLLGNATDQGLLGAMLAVMLVVALMTATSRPGRERLLLALGSVAALAAVILSASRAAIAALVVGMVLLAIVWVARGPRGRRLWRAVSAATVLAVLAGSALLLPLTQSRLLGTSPFASATVQGRLQLWVESLRVLAGAPLAGTGPNGFEDAVTAQHGPEWFPLFGYGSVIDSPHDIALQALLAGGPPLLLLAVVLVVGVVITATRRIRELGPRESEQGGRALILAALIAVLVWLVGATTHFTTAGPVILVAVCIGAIVARPAKMSSSATAAARGYRLLPGIAVVAWSVLAVTALAGEVALRTGVDAIAESPERANDAFDTARDLRPWDPDVLVIAAEEFAGAADRGDPAGRFASSWAQRAVDALPQSVPAAKALAAAQQYAGDFAAAEQTLRDLDARAPHDPQTLHRLGGILILLGRYDEADAALLGARALAPDEPGITETLAYLYQLTGDDEALEALLREAATL